MVECLLILSILTGVVVGVLGYVAVTLTLRPVRFLVTLPVRGLRSRRNTGVAAVALIGTSESPTAPALSQAASFRAEHLRDAA